MNQVSERVTAKRAQKGRRVLTSARGGGSKDNKAASWRCHGVLEKVTAKTGNSAGPRQVRSGPSVSTSGRRGSRRRGAWRRSVRVSPRDHFCLQNKIRSQFIAVSFALM